MAATQTKSKSEQIEALIFDTILYLDDRDSNVNRLAEIGCPSVEPVAHFLNLDSSSRLAWCEKTSKRLFQKSFEKPNEFHPWQYTWKLDTALNKIMEKDQNCRQMTFKSAIPGAAFRSAVASSSSNADAAQILSAWEKIGTNIDISVLELSYFVGHLKNKGAIPLLINSLDSNPQLSYRSAEVLILLTGKFSESFELEKLPSEVSRNPIFRLNPTYMEQAGLTKSWQNWWQEVQKSIHWDEKAEFTNQDLKAVRGKLKGKFVW